MKPADFITDILHKPIHSITGAAIVISSTTVLSGIAGIVRDRLLAATFGAGDVLDAYYAAFKIPDFLFMVIINGALSAGFIPLFSKYSESDGKEKTELFIKTILNFLSVLLIFLSIAIFALAPQLIKIIAPGFGPEKSALAGNLTRIMCFSPLFLGLSSVFSSALQSQKKFFATAAAPVLYNLGIIAGIIFARAGSFQINSSGASALGNAAIQWVAAGVIAGTLLHLGSQWIIMRISGFKHKFFFVPPKNFFVKELVVLASPRILTLLIFQLQVVVFTFFASLLPKGSISIYQFATNLYFLPSWIFGLSFALAAFPTLSQLAARSNTREFILQLSFVVRQMLFFCVPVSVFIILLRTEIVRIVLGSGSFDWNATRLTADTLAILASGISASGIYHLFVRAFYSTHDTKTPLIAAVFSVLTGSASALFFMRVLSEWAGSKNYAVAGLAMGLVISNIVSVAILWTLLRKKFTAGAESIKQNFIFSLYVKFTRTEKTIIFSVLRVLFATSLAGIGVQIAKVLFAPYLDLSTFFGVFLRLLSAILSGGAIYTAVMAALKSPELEHLISSLQKKWLKTAPVEEIETRG